MKRSIIFLFIGMLVANATAWALPGRISGKVNDAKSRAALEFVNVSVRKQGSGELLKGTVTDEEGNFLLNGLPEGKYVLSVSYIGYKELSRAFAVTPATAEIPFGVLLLEEDTQMLGEVQVVGQRSQMRFELDKKVFNVDQNIASTGGSASDVLTNIPSVEVDHEGQVSLRGNTSVEVWINGKAAGLTSDNRGDILQQMPAESIERIEVITNPSSRYSSEGTAGIINIVLKRDRRAGYFGGVQAGADTRGGYNASANINYSSGTWEAYGNIGYRRSLFENGGTTERTYLAEEGSELSSLHQDSEGEMDGGLTFVRAGATWHATDKDQLSLSGMGMFGGHDRDNLIDYLSHGNDAYSRQRNQSENGDMAMYNVELDYRHEFSENSTLDFALSRNYWKLDMENRYDDQMHYDNGTGTTAYQFQDNRTLNKGWEAQLDYTNKWGNHNLEAGYKGTFRRNNNPVSTYDGTSEEDAAFTGEMYNRFKFDQDIHAFYLSYGGKWGAFSLQGGLRGEYTRARTTSFPWNTASGAEAGGERHENDYFDLFPSLFLSYSLPKDNEIQLNYTRRVSRPWGGQLNNFRNITDATNISFGNPLLDAEYSNAFELNYIKNWDLHTFSLSGYYRSTDDVIQRISYRAGDNVMYSTYENVSQSQSAGMELVSKNRLFRILDLTTTVNLFYYKLDGFSFQPDGAQAPVTGEKDENFSWNARMIANLTLPASITLQLTGSYNARQVVAQGYRKANYSLDAGLRKSFFDNKLGVSINARDLLDSRKWKTVTSGAGFSQTAENWFGGRFVGFTLTYSFGNMRGESRSQRFDDGNIPENGMYNNMENM